MDLSLLYFANDSTGTGARYELLTEGARFADRNGFAAVWMPERHFHRFGGLYPNPAVTAAAVAMATEHVAIRAGSVVAPLHDPLRIAEEWAVVDNLSGGRAGVSFASGWHPVDFGLAPDHYADRWDRTLAVLAEVQALWRGESVARVDGRGEPVELRVYPPPVQAELPVWLTTTGKPEVFRQAGALGAGVLTHLVRQQPETLAENIAAYRAALGPGQRGHVTLMLHTFLDHDRDRAREIVREPMRSYLASSLNLVGRAPSAGARRDTARSLPEAKTGELLDLAFDRYFTGGGLFGDQDDAIAMVRRMAAIGVDEIACLIDFGVPAPAVLESLEVLAAVRESVAEEAVADVRRA